MNILDSRIRDSIVMGSVRCFRSCSSAFALEELRKIFPLQGKTVHTPHTAHTISHSNSLLVSNTDGAEGLTSVQCVLSNTIAGFSFSKRREIHINTTKLRLSRALAWRRKLHHALHHSMNRVARVFLAETTQDHFWTAVSPFPFGKITSSLPTYQHLQFPGRRIEHRLRIFPLLPPTSWPSAILYDHQISSYRHAKRES
jgi:hypothetical protein